MERAISESKQKGKSNFQQYSSGYHLHGGQKPFAEVQGSTTRKPRLDFMKRKRETGFSLKKVMRGKLHDQKVTLKMKLGLKLIELQFKGKEGKRSGSDIILSGEKGS